MTRNELATLLINAGLDAMFPELADATYETVSQEWVVQNWSAWLEARPTELVQFRSAGGKKIRWRPLWLSEAGDCDNLALGTMYHAQVGNALAVVRRKNAPRGGLAYGFLFYIAETHVQGGHAINWFVDHERRVRFFEPASGEVIDLTPTERSTTWFGMAC